MGRLEGVPNSVPVGVWDRRASRGLAEARLANAIDEARAVFDRLGVAVVFYAEAPIEDGICTLVALGAVRPDDPGTWEAFRKLALMKIEGAFRDIASDPKESRR